MKKNNIMLMMYLVIISVISFSTMYIDYFNNVGQAYYDDYMTVGIAKDEVDVFDKLNTTVESSGAHLVKVIEDEDSIDIYTDETIAITSPMFVKDVVIHPLSELNEYQGDYLVVDYTDQTRSDLKAIGYSAGQAMHSNMLQPSIVISILLFMIFMLYMIFNVLLLLNQNMKALFVTHISGKDSVKTINKIDGLNYKLIIGSLFVSTIIFYVVGNGIYISLFIMNIIFIITVLVIRYLIMYFEVRKVKKKAILYKMGDATSKKMEYFLKTFKILVSIVAIFILTGVSFSISKSINDYIFFSNMSEDLGEYGGQGGYFPSSAGITHEESDIIVEDFNEFFLNAESVDYHYYTYGYINDPEMGGYRDDFYSGPIIKIDQELASKYILDSQVNILYIPTSYSEERSNALIDYLTNVAKYPSDLNIVYQDVKIPNYSYRDSDEGNYFEDVPVLVVDEDYLHQYSNNFGGAYSSTLIKINDYDLYLQEMEAAGLSPDNLQGYHTTDERAKIEIKNTLVNLMIEVTLLIFVLLFVRKINNEIVVEDINNNLRVKLIQRLAGKSKKVIFKKMYRLNVFTYLLMLVLAGYSIYTVSNSYESTNIIIYTIIVSTVTLIYIIFDYLFIEKICEERLNLKIVEYLKGRK